MKKMIITFSLLLVVVLYGCSKNGQDSEDSIPPIDLGQSEVFKYTFDLHDGDTMPIGAWSDPPPANYGGVYGNPDLVTNEQYKLIKDSGINAIYGLYNDAQNSFDSAMKSLDYAEANGIVYLMRDAQVTGSYDDEDLQYLKNALDRYKDHPAFGGSMVVDEPGVASFNNLANLHENYSDYLPDKAFYINMLPSYASKNQLVNGAAGGNMIDDTITYGKYVEDYITRVKPKFYSYDYYPLVGLEYGQTRGGYFEELSIIREKSNAGSIPYWVFIQSSSWAPSSLRVPNDVEIQWQVSTSLAYGAKGIQYFMYYTSMEEGAESFVGGMVDKNGNINDTYYYVQKANIQIKAVDEILMNASHEGVMVNGDTPDSIPEKDILSEYSVLKSVSGDDALVGLFNYNGKPVYYVVNNSLTHTNGSITLEFDRTVDLSLIQDGVQSVQTGESITLEIPAGEGVLVEVK